MSNFFAQKIDYEEVQCNLCGVLEEEVLATQDQKGRQARTVLCRRCGLIFITPRMTKDWYRRYYTEEYRRDRSKAKDGGDQSPEMLFKKTERFGYALADLVEPHVKKGLIIEVGSSTGGVLAGFKRRLGDIEVIGIEPSSAEAQYANQRGIKTYAALFEDFNEELPSAANILSTRTINHMLNPKAFFSWAWHQLMPQGKLILVVLNFRHSVKKKGALERAIQIDHPYMFTPEVLVQFVSAAGFDILSVISHEDTNFRKLLSLKAKGLPGTHIYLIAQKSQIHPFIDSFMMPAKLGEAVLESLTSGAVRRYWAWYQALRVLWRVRARFL